MPSPPYGPSPPRDGEFRPYDQNDQASEATQRATNQPVPSAATQLSPQQQPPSPRKSMFDYFSPFDHLSNSSTQVKKKPVPTASAPTGPEDNVSWEPKRPPVDNLLENLTRGQAPSLQTAQPPPPPYESYLSGSDFSQGESTVTSQTKTAPPPPQPQLPSMPPKFMQPRAASPPKSVIQRPSARSEMNLPPSSHPAPSIAGSIAGSVVGGRRGDKESSPGPRGGYRNKANKNNHVKNQTSPTFVMPLC